VVKSKGLGDNPTSERGLRRYETILEATALAFFPAGVAEMGVWTAVVRKFET